LIGKEMANKLILHDIAEDSGTKMPADDLTGYTIFSAIPTVHHCIGCFGCWLKTPGHCVIKDRGSDFVAHIVASDEIIVISRMVFGGLSPDIKAVFDRSIGVLLPFFCDKNNEMHHSMRYERSPDLRYIFYGPDITENEKLTAKKLVTANAVNWAAENHSVEFCSSSEECLDLLKTGRD
jgi:multimeric flavodoxin WrbA